MERSRTLQGRSTKIRTDVVRPEVGGPRPPSVRGSHRDADPLSGPEPVNEVRLVGRVSGPPRSRVLPSGAELVQWTVVVARAAGGQEALACRRRVDPVDCVAWTGTLQAVARTLPPDSMVAVRGCLRRRFFRTGTAVQSRCEVEASEIRPLPTRVWDGVPE